MPDRNYLTAESIESIRLRPAMYIGSVGSAGVEELVWELVNDCLGQFHSGGVSRITVRLKANEIVVSSDGNCMEPVDSAGGFVSRLEFSIPVSLEDLTRDGPPRLHDKGVGLPVVNALSSRLILRNDAAGQRHTLTFRRGTKIRCEVETTPGIRSSMSISFTPDRKIFGNNRARPEVLRRMIFHTAHLNPGVRMEFGSERFHAPRGLADWIDLFSDDRGPRFQAVVTSGFHIIHAAAAGSSDATLWHSWVNGRPSPEHGVHVTGFRNALGRCRWKPRAAAIHVAVGSARFAGATRDKLVNGDVALGVEQALLPLIQAALHSGGM